MKIDIEHTEEQNNNCILLGRVPGIVILGITIAAIGAVSMTMDPPRSQAADILGGSVGAWLIFLMYDFSRKKKNAKYHLTTLTVQFSEEERQIIDDNGLHDTVVIEMGHDDYGISQGDAEWSNNNNVTIGGLMRGSENRRFLDLKNAKLFEAQIRDSMPKLKDHIVNFERGVEKSQSFEL